MRRHRFLLALVIGLALPGLAGCSSTDEPAQAEADSNNSATETGGTATSDAPPLEGDVRGSVEQVSITGAAPGTDLMLTDTGGATVSDGTTDDQGSLLIRSVEPGDGYTVRSTDGATSDAITVTDRSTIPDQSLYTDQTLEPGYQYITTRDGTTLAASVYLPGPAVDGPYPTVVEYSGYDPANPTATLETMIGEDGPVDPANLCADGGMVRSALPVLCDGVPAQPGSLLASVLGFAVVSVNMRGTGCSGGAYDFFEELQVLDGYDVIETVAAQSWVKNNSVGMVGLSYPGISQLYVARSNPPSLAAIAPLSVIDDTYRGTLRPGGIYNSGFAAEWAGNVLEDAEAYGQGWEEEVVADEEAEGGQSECAANQLLRGQNRDILELSHEVAWYDEDFLYTVPQSFVDQIDVPVFLTGAWHDEQTGPHFANMLDDFTTDQLRVTMFNGTHADGFGPSVLPSMNDFLDFYVSEEVPEVPLVVSTFGGLLFDLAFGWSLKIPESRFGGMDFQTALAAYESEQPVRVIFESGAGSATVGAPTGTYEATFDSWPLTETEATPLYLQPDGSLADEEPGAGGGASTFAFDPDAGGVTTFDSETGSIFDNLPEYDWPVPDPEKVVRFETEPLATDTVLLGPASADIWVESTADDTDIEVTVSEVRPDGIEFYVESGWLRAGHRALDEDESTELVPVQHHVEDENELLPSGEPALMRIEIFNMGHIFRAGSKIRIAIDTPGGSRPRWQFELLETDGDVTNTIHHSADYPSRVVLPVVPDLSGWPDAAPACPSLRGQPCRPAPPIDNQTTT